MKENHISTAQILSLYEELSPNEKAEFMAFFALLEDSRESAMPLPSPAG